MQKDIFISYSSEDEPVALEICNLIEERGIQCWIAKRDIVSGSHYAEAIVDAIRSTFAMLLVLTENSNTSVHVRNGVERAVHYGKAIIPIRVRNVLPSKALELYISTPHWVEWWIPPIDQRIDQLVMAIKALKGIPPPAASREPAAQPPVIPRPAAPRPAKTPDLTPDPDWRTDTLFFNRQNKALIVRCPRGWNLEKDEMLGQLKISLGSDVALIRIDADLFGESAYLRNNAPETVQAVENFLKENGFKFGDSPGNSSNPSRNRVKVLSRRSFQAGGAGSLRRNVKK